MHLTSVSIEGFKSYGPRVEIGPFHRQFTAITGMNGTGKSNILDAICFVMGMRSLQQIRVTKQDELVYKMGQAGIRKATVTLVFDNNDKRCSPPGYVACDTITITRQIILGGRDRYVLNGKVKRQSDVHSLFHSVQCNILNPHFLIMQGRITKVVNMKPNELLTMLEEAAGTKMYDNKRLESMLRVERKQKELDDIEAILQEEIIPGLNLLQKEQENYIAWTQNTAELDSLRKIVTQLTYLFEKKKLSTANDEKQQIEQQINSLENQCNELFVDVESIQKTIQGLAPKKTSQGSFHETERKLQECRRSLAVLKEETRELTNEINLGESTVKDFKTKLTLITEKRDLLKDSSKDRLDILEKSKLAFDEANRKLKDTENMIHTLRTGRLEGGETLIEKMMNEKERLRELENDHNILLNNIKDAEKNIEGQSHNKQRLIEKNNQILKKVRANIERCQNDIESIQFENDDYENACVEREAVKARIGPLKEEDQHENRSKDIGLRRLVEADWMVDELKRAGFDSVIGSAISLLHNVSPEYTLALEESAKGKLFHIIMKDDSESERIFSYCEKRKRRITIVPLNKISSKGPKQNIVDEVRKITSSHFPSESVHFAFELMHCNSAYDGVINYLFGSNVFVSDSQVANLLYQHRIQCVTKDGTSYNPSGSITGGSSVGMQNVLHLQHLRRQRKSTLAELRKSSRELKAYIKLQETKKANFDKLSHLLYEFQSEETRVLNVLNVSTSSYYESQYNQYCKDLSELEIQLKEQTQLVETLSRDAENFNHGRESKINQLLNSLPKLRKSSESAEKKYLSLRNSNISREIEVFSREMEDLHEEIQRSELMLNESREKMVLLGESIKSHHENESDIQNELIELQKEFQNSSIQWNDLKDEISVKENAISVNQGKMEKLKHRLSQLILDISDRGKHVKNLTREHPWLTKEVVDTLNYQLLQARKELERKEEAQSTLSMNINKKAHSLLQNTQARYDELMTKKEQVMRERENINNFIMELDQKKSHAVTSCYNAVNENFTEIFQTLLPGTRASLGLVEEREGVEMNVAFGDQPKSGLGELSGGQRSLLALSLILALCKFKPSPFYILDEIDAALDLSHTQNIGAMIRKHFTAQFIIVSLKDNMFNNADVIFTTRFENGHSCVDVKQAST